MSFIEFRNRKKGEQIQKAGLLFLLFGIPVIIIFAAADKSAVGISGTLGWRIFGITPMLIFIIARLASIVAHTQLNSGVLQWLGTSIILGVTGMMAAMLYKVLTNSSSVDEFGLAGTVAGNLLGIFAVGLLHGIRPGRATAAVILPYAVISILLAFHNEVSSDQWVFTGNVLAATVIVTIIIWRSERADDDRLRTLFELQEDRVNLEKAVAERTEKLEFLLKEIHHRVRNNLQIILSVINLYENDYSDNCNDKRLMIIQNIVQIIEYTHHLTHHDQIMEKVDMQLLLDEICSDTYWPEESLTVKKDIEKILIKPDIAIVIGIICVHLISQAESLCLVTFHCSKNGAMLSVTIDAGIQTEDCINDIAGSLASLINSEIIRENLENKTVTLIRLPVAD